MNPQLIKKLQDVLTALQYLCLKSEQLSDSLQQALKDLETEQTLEPGIGSNGLIEPSTK